MADRPDQPDRPVVLLGLMAAGKTSVATRLAELLGRPVRDSDRDLERRYGATAAEQYRRHGVEVLHAREASQLREALAARPAPVIAAAASVVDDPGCRAALAAAGAYAVWLDAPPGVLADRLEASLAESPGRDPAADPAADSGPDLAADRHSAADHAADAAGDSAGQDHRPAFQPDLRTVLTEQYAQRAARFRAAADLVVDVSDRTPEQAAKTVLAGLAGSQP